MFPRCGERLPTRQIKGVPNGGNGFLGYTFRLTADIDLSSVCNAEDGTSWGPIGKNDNGPIQLSFQGTFKGGGHTISNLYINKPTNSLHGLFGYIKNATIDSLNVVNTDVTGRESVGGICGRAYTNSTISNCFHSGSLKGDYSIGGMSGMVSDSDISNCVNSGHVIGTDSVGGVCGYSDKANFFNCLNTGQVSGSNKVGGVCGQVTTNSTISDCLNSGQVSGTANYVGGVCGYANVNSTICNSFNSGTVHGSLAGGHVGGVCGTANNSNIFNCLNNGSVVAEVCVGGVCGDVETSSTITNCLNSGYVDGISRIGGVCGLATTNSIISNSLNSGTVDGIFSFGGVCGATDGGTITNCYYDNQMSPFLAVSNDETSGNGNSTTELITNNLFVGNGNWTKAEGLYPVLSVFANTEAGKVATTPVLLTSNEKANDVHSNFAVSKANGVTWTSKRGRVHIAKNGECTILASGRDTLVCTLENESKEIFLRLTYEPTIDNLTDLQNFRDAVNDYENGEYKGVRNGGNGFSGVTFRLTANIEMNNQESWTPIGGSGYEFEGTFKGGGYTISNLYIDAESSDYQGLFGAIYNATIDSLNLANTNIKGRLFVGGVCGLAFNNSTISNCLHSGHVIGTGSIGGVCGEAQYYSTISNCLNSGNVSGHGWSGHVGGVCGDAHNQSNIFNCINSGNVSGTYNVGGVCGDDYDYSAITNCLNTGNVSGTSIVGGVCGLINEGTITNCYYDNQMCPLAHAVGNDETSGNGNSTAELIGSQIFADNENWIKTEGLYPVPTVFANTEAGKVAAAPVLLTLGEKANRVRSNFTVSKANGVTWTSKQGKVHIAENGECTFTDGGRDTLVCTLGNARKEVPLILVGTLTIDNLEEFVEFRDAVNDYQHGVYKDVPNGNNGFLGYTFRLTDNIDLSSVCNAEDGTSWEPIGKNGDAVVQLSFQGTFKGGGYTISNLYINKPNSKIYGLFGYIKNATIDSLNLVNTNITGKESVGGICGSAYTNSTISNCLHSGSVRGNYKVGGMSGWALGYSSISNCINTGHVFGTDSVGGVCGYANDGALITNCLNIGQVNGKNKVGGVCGFVTTNSTISNNLNTGYVNGTSNVGGVCGYKENGTITNCHYDNQMCPLARAVGNYNDSGSGNSTVGFIGSQIFADNENWTQNTVAVYPVPSVFADTEAGKVAAVPVVLKNGENVNCVRSNFNIHKAYNVTWTSKQGKVHMAENGGCTILALGPDTLVCTLGNARKEVPIVLVGTLTIDNLTDLQNFRDAVNDYQNGMYKGVPNNKSGFAGYAFRLTDNIDLSSVCNETLGNWIPIGGYESDLYRNPFQGTFQGGGHTISNLYIDAPSKFNQGLFAHIKNATIDSLNVVNTNIKGKDQVGGICGWGSGSTISNSLHSGSVRGSDCVGGVCGQALNNFSISNCINSGHVSGTDTIGGVCGYILNHSTITDCLNTGHVSGADKIGGMCGYVNDYVSISYCLNSGHVSGTNDVGGVCGNIYRNSYISDCLNSVIVSGAENVGGVCGYASDGTTISYSLNSGYVSGTGNYVAAVCGRGHNHYLELIYYDKQVCPLEHAVTDMPPFDERKSTSELIGSQIFANRGGWTKTEGLYPVPSTFANKEVGKVAASTVFLQNNETADEVRTNFTVSKANGVTWTSKQGKVHIAENGECAILAGGVDTLVCTLGNSRKEVPLVLVAFDLVVGGTQVTYSNLNNITGEGITIGEEGYLRYDQANNTLQMKNVTIETSNNHGIWSIIDGLTIEIAGENSVTTNSASFNGIHSGNEATTAAITITGDGTLAVSSPNNGILSNGNIAIEYTEVTATGGSHGIAGNGSNNLTITQSIVTATATTTGSIANFADISLNNARIAEPEGVAVGTSNGAKGVVASEESNTLVTGEVRIDPIYNLWIAGTQVTVDNANNITGTGITPMLSSGIIYFNGKTNTLTLKDVRIETSGRADLGLVDDNCIKNWIDNLTVEVLGENEISTIDGKYCIYSGYYTNASDFSTASIKFTGDGTLSVSSNDNTAFQSRGNITLENATFTFSGGENRYGFYSNRNIDITNATVTANAIGENSYGLSARGNITIENSTVTATGGCGINAGENLTIQNSTVSANGTTSGIESSSSEECELIINNSTVSAIGPQNGSIHRFDAITLHLCYIASPKGAAIRECSNKKGITINSSSSTLVKERVVISTEHDFVDLGLPSGTLWATCNVGANAPEEYGDHFAWGETEPKDDYIWDTYKFGSFNIDHQTFGMTKYNQLDGISVLEPEDDAAVINWGEEWCMPTKENQEELLAHCTWTWTSNYNDSGVAGYIVSSKAEGNDESIFLPAAGSYNSNTLSMRDKMGTYLSSSLFVIGIPNNYFINFQEETYLNCRTNSRYLGYSVRPVIVDAKPTVRTVLGEISNEDKWAEVGCEIVDIGKSELQERGVVYSTSPNPVLEGASRENAKAFTEPTCRLTNLENGTYYVRAYAENRHGISYGEQKQFSIVALHTGHGYVDLGLPSGILWATCNIGATAPEEYGDYFAWGETQPKSNYAGLNYEWGMYDLNDTQNEGMTKYNRDDGKTVLEPGDDAAHANWSGAWRMPTQEEQNELRTQCTWTWTNSYNGTGVAGYIVSSNAEGNNNSIFLPAAGYYQNSNLLSAGSCGYYYASLVGDSPSYSVGLTFAMDGFIQYPLYRSYGLSIRPVITNEKPIVQTAEVTEVSNINRSAVVGGKIVDTGLAGIAEQGVVYSTSPNPEIGGEGVVKERISGLFTFSKTLTYLESGTYYVRAYAANKYGTSYGEQKQFSIDAPSYMKHDFVNLGLPSGMLWATCNIGASKPNEYGDYFAWGEVQPKYEFTESNYTYTGNSDVLKLQYDAADSNWGGTWRIPTKAHLQELMDNCTWTWTSHGGVSGYDVEGPNGNSIFLPAAGYGLNTDLYGENILGRYWTSELADDPQRGASCFDFASVSKFFFPLERYHGLPIRPVFI